MGGGVGGRTFKSLGKLSNSWTDWHQIWYTSADSSGNERRLNTIHPSISQGAFWGFQGVTNSKSVEAVKRLDRLALNFVHVYGFIWEWTQAKYKLPHNTTGGIFGLFYIIGGHKFNYLGKLSNCSTDWHQIWYMSADSSGNGHS